MKSRRQRSAEAWQKKYEEAYGKGWRSVSSMVVDTEEPRPKQKKRRSWFVRGGGKKN